MKRLVLCLDGTNNLPTGGRTHVVRMYRMLARVPGVQLGYYQPGVGTLAPSGVLTRSGQFLLRGLDSATAWMIERHVAAAYRFLMRHYDEGDEIAVFGFSRGAFNARVLCGLLNQVGLLHAGLDEMLPFAWRSYRFENDYQQIGRFRKTFCRPVSVRFLGLWDTVSSVGTPWRPRTFRHTANNDAVAVVRHAVALDERRAFYVQNLWSATPADAQDVLQVAFPGVHSDVGGGYPESSDEHLLGLIPLAWMLREAHAAGLLFDAEQVAALLGIGAGMPADSALATLTDRHAAADGHESLRGPWHLAEWLPVPRWRLDADGGHVRRWRCHRGRARRFGAAVRFHRSLALRRERRPDYQPDNLPENPEWVD